jgi:hypothetical protein
MRDWADSSWGNFITGRWRLFIDFPRALIFKKISGEFTIRKFGRILEHIISFNI